jgi:ABC-type phosphate transport system substrate-binding protein
MSVLKFLAISGALAVVLTAGGCANQRQSAATTTVASAPTAPGASGGSSQATQEAMKAQGEQRMKQAMEMARRTWQSAHPGKPVPPGL